MGILFASRNNFCISIKKLNLVVDFMHVLYYRIIIRNVIIVNIKFIFQNRRVYLSENKNKLRYVSLFMLRLMLNKYHPLVLFLHIYFLN